MYRGSTDTPHDWGCCCPGLGSIRTGGRRYEAGVENISRFSSFQGRGYAWTSSYRYQRQNRVQCVQQHQCLGLGLSAQPFTPEEHSVDLDGETSEDEDEELLNPHPSHVNVKT